MRKRKSEKEAKIAVFQTSEVVFLILVTSVVSCTMGFVFSRGYQKFDENTVEIKDENLKKIIDNYQYIQDNYYKEIDKKAFVKGAVAGMVESLGDQYSAVIDSENSESFNRTLDGWFTGIGVEVGNNEEGNIVISYVFEDSSAKRNGIEVGDVIISINGTNFEKKSYADAAAYLKKQTNTPIDMVVLRNGSKLTIRNLSKEKVILQSVVKEIFERNQKKIGYLYISTFSGTTFDQVKKNLEELEREKIDGLIIDMRNNTGGHLTSAEKILSLFLDKKHVIYQVQSKTGTTKTYSRGSENKPYPIAILQNKITASASEIVSAALKEEYGATVIGTVSYGKGTIQDLVNGDMEYKVTTKKWLTPKGEWINEIGVEPDLKIELAEEYKNNPSNETDNQLQTAINTLVK